MYIQTLNSLMQVFIKMLKHVTSFQPSFIFFTLHAHVRIAFSSFARIMSISVNVSYINVAQGNNRQLCADLYKNIIPFFVREVTNFDRAL